VYDDEIIGQGYNQPRAMADPTAHAEIVALRAACAYANNYRLPGATVYVTLEPCLMCIGSLIHARVYRLVYGAAEPKTGAVESICRTLDDLPHNHVVKVSTGVLEKECKCLVQNFFRAKR
jgi:tRNA(adenine34) deaminase